MKIFIYFFRWVKVLAFKRSVQWAGKAFEKRDWDDAARHYRRAVGIRPDASWIWVQYGHALKEAGSLEGAAAAYQNAVSQKSTDEETHYHLADVLRRLGRENDMGRVLGDAVKISRDGSSSSQENAFILLNRAKAEIAVSGRTLDAEEQFEAALKLHPSVDSLVQYGHALKDGNRYADAEAQYRRALELSPRNADTHLHLGHSLKLQGRIQLAIAAYRAAFHLCVAADDVQRHAREELQRLGIPVTSEIEIPQDLRNDRRAGAVLSLIGNRQWSSVADRLEELPEEARTPRVLEFTAQILTMIGDHKKAYSLLESLVSAGYASETVFLLMAQDREASNNLSDAVDLYGKALAIGMRFGDAFEALVRLKEYSRIFAIVEPAVFPASGDFSEVKDCVVIAAAGRTPGMLLPKDLAETFHRKISEKAETLEAKGFTAQAKLFRLDAAHFPI